MPILPTYNWMKFQTDLNNASRSLECNSDCDDFEILSRRLRFDYFQFSVGPGGLWWTEELGPLNPSQTVNSDINEDLVGISVIEVLFASVSGFNFTTLSDGSGRVIGLQLPITYIGINAGGPSFYWEDERLNIEVAAVNNLLITGYGIGSIVEDEKRLLFVGSHQAICLASGDHASCNYNFVYHYST